MITLPVADFFPEAKTDRKKLLNYLSEYVKKYPASTVLVIAYLKLLKEVDVKKFEKEKKKWLSSIFNKAQFAKINLKFQETDTASAEDIVPANIDGLIETFYQNPPKMKFNPKKHDADENFAKKSLLEDDMLISETLAMVYAEQGCYKKAEKMLKKLRLHFPEKSCYFAGLIEEVRKSKESNT